MIRITSATETGAAIMEGILIIIVRLVAIVMYKASVTINSLNHLLLSNMAIKII